MANLLLAGGLPAAAQSSNPHFVAWPVDDNIAGWEWQPDAPVTVTVDTFSGTADTDEWGNFFLSLEGFDLQGGHTITVTDGTSTKTHTVTSLAVHSDTYQWLVINRAGTNAQYKGSGRINGELAPNGEAYKFMLWARDDDPDLGDTFRIRICYEIEDELEVAVYDNGFDQTIGRGNMTIHTKK